MKMETMELPVRPATALPSVDVTLTVTRFQNLLEPTATSPALSDFDLSGPEEGNGRLKVGDYQKGSPPGARHTLRVQRPGVVLRFTIASGKDGERYLPVGISFERADLTTPIAVPCTTDAASPAGSPFSSLRIDGPTITVVDRPLGSVPSIKEPTPPRRVSYKFSILLQRERDGALGLIDPTIENENMS